jgi:hypothetical protein
MLESRLVLQRFKYLLIALFEMVNMCIPEGFIILLPRLLLNVNGK